MADELTLHDDNADSLDDPAQTRTSPSPEFGDPEPARGALLEYPDPKAARLAAKLFDSTSVVMRRRIAQWTVNRLRRRGVPNVALVQKAATDYTAYIPPNVTADVLPTVNRAATICRRLTSLMLVDPPRPEPVPATAEDDDVDSMEVAGKILEDVDGESGLDAPSTWRKALDLAHSYASGFIHYFVDPRGGGYQPIEVEAGPDATSVDDALGLPQTEPRLQPHPLGLADPMTGEPAMVPATDPLTGEEIHDPVLDEAGEPVTIPWPEYVTRYVRPDGTLTDNPAEAASRWMPKLDRELMTGVQVRPIPHDAEDIWQCRGVQLGWFRTWGELKARYPQLEQLQPTELAAVLGFRPRDEAALLAAAGYPGKRRPEFNEGDNPDERLVFGITTYYVMGDEYAQGCHCITLGDSVVVERGPWYEERADGTVGRMEIPVVQIKQFDEGELDFFGTALMEVLGGGNEQLLAIWSSMLEHLERFSDRLVFVPMHSNLRPEHFRRGTGSVIPVLPNGTPVFEDVPELPQFIPNLFELVKQSLDDASGLQDTASGVENPNVTSGKQAYLVIAQAHAGLSELKGNLERAVRRDWRIKLQLIRAHYTAPQKLQWESDDAGYKQIAWSGADLSSTRDIRIQPGSFTMLTPTAKAQLAEHFASLQLYSTPWEFRDVMVSQVGGLMGLQEEPSRLRIKRQLRAWRDGPPEGWQPEPPPAMPAPMAAMAAGGPLGAGGLPGAAPMTTGGPLAPLGPAGPLGAPPIGSPAPAVVNDPELLRIFQPVPSDTAPEIAAVRLHEIKRLMQSRVYLQKPPEWRAGLDAEFYRMQAAAAAPAMPAAAAGAPAQAPEGANPLVPGTTGEGSPLPGGML